MTRADAKASLTMASEAFNEAGMPSASLKVTSAANAIFTTPITPAIINTAILDADRKEMRKSEAEEALFTAMKAFEDVGDADSMIKVDEVGREIMGEEA